MSARSTQIFIHNETNFTMEKTEESLPHGEWGHDGDQRPPQIIDGHATGEIGSDSHGVVTGTEGSVRYRIEDGSGSSFYFHWNNPFEGRNGYHQFTDHNYEIFHTGGKGDNAVVHVYIRPSERHTAKNFLPSVHGFKFSNRYWGEIPYSLPPLKGSILDYKYGNAANGLCGGMVYAVRDYFEAGIPVPDTTSNPPGEQDQLFVYIVERLFDAFDIDDVTLYLKYMNPAYPDTDETILNSLGAADGRAYVVANVEWPLIRHDIDAGHPSPMGLVRGKSLLPSDLGNNNHQVLAYAYEVHGQDVELWIYDPNFPNEDDVRLTFNIQTTAEPIRITHTRSSNPVYCFFRTNYAFSQPPILRTKGESRAVVARSAEHLDLFWIGADGGVGSSWWDAGTNEGIWNPPFAVARSGSALPGAVAAAARNADHLDVFWIGADGGVGSNWWNDNIDNGQWHTPFAIAPPHAAQMGAITAVAQSTDHLDVFWIRPDGAVGSNWWDATLDNGQWHEPFPVTPSHSVQPGAVTAVSRKPGFLDVFWIAVDGAVGTNWWDANANDGQWNAPFAISPQNAAQPGAITAVSRAPDHLDVFWIGIDGAVGTNWWDANRNDGQWNKPFALSEPNLARKGAVACVARTHSQLDIFWIGHDGAVWSAWWNAQFNEGRWSVPFIVAPAGSARGDSHVAAIAREPDHLDVFWIGADGAIGSTWWHEGESWSKPFPITEPGML
jgi:hypothetical protein